MDVHLTARHLKITQPIRNYVREKVDKAQKYFDHIIWAQAVLFIEKRTHNAEIVIHASRQTFRAKATAADIYSAVDLASDKIDAQLKKYKERLRDHHKAPSAPQDGENAPPLAAGAPSIALIKQSVLELTAQQAAEEMESRGQAFLLYQDRETGQIRVIYRRSDETLGILQPVKKGKR